MNDTTLQPNGNASTIPSVGKESYNQVNILGLDVQISKVLGDVVVENYVKQLSEEDMKRIIDYMSQDLFEEVRDYHSDDPEAKIKRVRSSWEEGSGSVWGRKKVVSVGDHIKEKFNERIKEELKMKIDEIIATTDYKEKIEFMAQEIVDYATEGYKEDLKANIREKMIGNIMNAQPCYGAHSLHDIINHVIDTRFNH